MELSHKYTIFVLRTIKDMKILNEIVKTNVKADLDFAEFYLEHNGRKFRVHYEATRDVPCARIGGDWYQSLSIMTADGTWEQITDARVVGAYTHYELCNTPIQMAKYMLDKAIKKFQDYIIKIY